MQNLKHVSIALRLMPQKNLKRNTTSTDLYKLYFKNQKEALIPLMVSVGSIA